MHVLLPVVSRFTQLTGICRNTINHAKAVADLPGAKVTLVVGPWQQDYFRRALRDSTKQIHVITADCRNNSLSRNHWYANELPEVTRRLAPDVVHLAYPTPFKRSRFSVPVVSTVHDLYPFDLPGNFGFPRVIFNRKFLKQCVDQSDALICVSESTRDRLTHYFPLESARKHIATIYSYSELQELDPTPPADFPFERFILTVGQHRKNKNLDLLLHACASLVSSGRVGRNVGFVFAGAGGPETPRLNALVGELRLQQRVLFCSDIPDEVLAWFYRNCDLFVAPSSIEGFCLPLLEAIQLSPRVLCSDIGVFREVAHGACDFFSLSGSAVDNLANALQSALFNHSVPMLPSQRFSRRNASRNYGELYSRVAEMALPRWSSDSLRVAARSRPTQSLAPHKGRRALPRSNILGVGVHAVDMGQAVAMIEDVIEGGDKGYVCLSGVHGIMESYRDPDLRSIVNNAALVAPDGMPTVWLGWLQGLRRMRRVFGPELMLQVCRRSVAMGYTHFLYGGKPGVAHELKHNLETMFPGIRIVGIYTPPFRSLSPQEEIDVANIFTSLKPDITWIGLSTPKQERFMAQHISNLDTRVMIGVGAAFDIHTGRLRDCPAWMKPVGLQWVHRLAQEPRRLWRRYAYYNPLFVYNVALQIAGIRRYTLPDFSAIPLANSALSLSTEVPLPPDPDFQQRAS